MEQVAKLLEQLATKLGTTVEYLWGVLMKQAHVNAIINLSFVGLMLIITITWLAFIPKIIKLDSDDGDYDSPSTRTLTWIFFAITNVISIIVIIACLTTAITELLNPEYWALQEILGQLKN